MRHISLGSLALFLTTAACSQATPEASSPPQRAERKIEVAKAAPPAEAPRTERKVGDFWVHRISGTFSTKAMMLIERVVAKDENGIAVEYTLEDSDGSSQMIVWRDAENDVIVGVARVVEGKQVPGSLADFEDFMAKTIVVPDTNEGYVDRTLGTCLVGPSELDCETKSYRVRIGDREANLDITRSAKYPGRDIGGEISTKEGEVIYRAELLESGNAASAKDSFASVDR